uniref:Uncharacterized protein n=1 Tax=Romanomermis culicivorax TaxID=13658 RepID=A0A915HIX6_ROMCU
MDDQFMSNGSQCAIGRIVLSKCNNSSKCAKNYQARKHTMQTVQVAHATLRSTQDAAEAELQTGESDGDGDLERSDRHGCLATESDTAVAADDLRSFSDGTSRNATVLRRQSTVEESTSHKIRSARRANSGRLSSSASNDSLHFDRRNLKQSVTDETLRKDLKFFFMDPVEKCRWNNDGIKFLYEEM